MPKSKLKILALFDAIAPTTIDQDLSVELKTDDWKTEANVLASTAEGAAGQAFNIACGDRISLNDLLGEIRELSGSDLSAQYLSARTGDIPHSLADISLAREILDFNPEVQLREGLARTIEYHRGAGIAEQSKAQT